VNNNLSDNAVEIRELLILLTNMYVKGKGLNNCYQLHDMTFVGLKLEN